MKLTLEELIDSQLTMYKGDKRMPNNLKLIAEEGSVHHPILKDYEFYLFHNYRGVYVFRKGKLLWSPTFNKTFTLTDIIYESRENEAFLIMQEKEAEEKKWKEYLATSIIKDIDNILLDIKPYLTSRWSKTHNNTRIYENKDWKIVVGATPQIIALVDKKDNTTLYEGKIDSSWFVQQLLKNTGVK